jgi:hypothetical protein
MNPALAKKISSLSLSPSDWGERVRVRGHLTDIFSITPHLNPLPSRGEEIMKTIFPGPIRGEMA